MEDTNKLIGREGLPSHTQALHPVAWEMCQPHCPSRRQSPCDYPGQEHLGRSWHGSPRKMWRDSQQEQRMLVPSCKLCPMSQGDSSVVGISRYLDCTSCVSKCVAQ